jgi:hypothetical protein
MNPNEIHQFTNLKKPKVLTVFFERKDAVPRIRHGKTQTIPLLGRIKMRQMLNSGNYYGQIDIKVLNNLGPKEQRAALASFIVDVLEEDQNSPFYNAIQYVGEEREPHHILRDYQLSRFISRILKEKALSGLSHERFASLYSEYWSAIRELYPESFKKPREYRLLKSPGIATYTYLFPTVFAYSASEGKITKSQFKHYLSMLQEQVDDEQLEMDFRGPIDDDWWSMASGPSISASTSEKLFAEIIKNLTKIDLVLKKKSSA